jgi:hypothetical protein
MMAAQLVVKITTQLQREHTAVTAPFKASGPPLVYRSFLAR